MLIFQIILAVLAVAALTLFGRGPVALAAALGVAAIDVALGTSPVPALLVVAPVVAFLSAAFTLAALVERSGLAERTAFALARTARGDARILYVLVCGVCALLTAAVSLDASVVLMVPLLAALAQRFGAPFGVLFLGVVAVANSASIAVAQGNPTNLVVIGQLGIDSAAFTRHMLLPGLIAALTCAYGVALHGRRELGGRYELPAGAAPPLRPAERHALLALASAALAAWGAPLAGAAPWWPFSLAVLAAIVLSGGAGGRLVVPWRLGLQLAGMLIAIGSLHLAPAAPAAPGPMGLLVVAGAVGAAAALANNLPVSLSLVALFEAGPSALAASIGLAVGSLATPQGSVATLVATDLAGADAPPVRARLFAPLAALATAIATLALWAGL